MSESMPFPTNWKEFLQEYSFLDIREVYTNGARLIPVFRVEQMMEHYLVEKQVVECWYQEYYRLLGEFISLIEKLPVLPVTIKGQLETTLESELPKENEDG